MNEVVIIINCWILEIMIWIQTPEWLNMIKWSTLVSWMLITHAHYKCNNWMMICQTSFHPSKICGCLWNRNSIMVKYFILNAQSIKCCCNILRNNFISKCFISMFTTWVTNTFVSFPDEILGNESTFCECNWLDWKRTTKSSRNNPLISWWIWSSPWIFCVWRCACSWVNTFFINWDRILIWTKLLCINHAKSTHRSCCDELHILLYL